MIFIQVAGVRKPFGMVVDTFESAKKNMISMYASTYSSDENKEYNKFLKKEKSLIEQSDIEGFMEMMYFINSSRVSEPAIRMEQIEYNQAIELEQ